MGLLGLGCVMRLPAVEGAGARAEEWPWRKGDADGDLDVVTAAELGIFVLENLGEGVLADPPVMVTVPSDPPALVVLDPTFTSSTTEMLELQGRVAGAADVDEDGRPDVAVILGDGTSPVALWLSGG